ncbi:MAG: TetR/AcrR family transcriptional regulator [Myxococcota bacterium]
MNRNSSHAGARRAVREARQEAYRGLILDAALRVFAERGYADAKVSEIAAAAGIATGTVYAIFESKQELYRAVHAEYLAELAQRYAEVPADGPVDEVLLARSAVSTRFLTERPDYLRVYLREAVHWGFDATDLPAGAGAFLDPDLYRRGVEEGVLRDEDPEVLHSLAMSAGQVHLFHWWKAGGKEPAERLVARIQDHYRRALFV